MKKSRKVKNKKNIGKILLKVLIILLILDVIFIPLFILAEVKPMVGMCIFIFFPLLMALFVVLLSKNCLNSYENKKKMIEDKMNK